MRSCAHDWSNFELTSGEDLAYRPDVVQNGPIIENHPIYYLFGTDRQSMFSQDGTPGGAEWVEQSLVWRMGPRIANDLE